MSINPSNVFVTVSDIANTTITVTAIGTFNGNVLLGYTQYNQDYLSCGQAPTPSSVALAVGGSATSRVSCYSSSVGVFTLNVVGRSGQGTDFKTITLNFTSVQVSGSSNRSIYLPEFPAPSAYVVLGLITSAVAVVITVYLWKSKVARGASKCGKGIIP